MEDMCYSYLPYRYLPCMRKCECQLERNVYFDSVVPVEDGASPRSLPLHFNSVLIELVQKAWVWIPIEDAMSGAQGWPLFKIRAILNEHPTRSQKLYFNKSWSYRRIGHAIKNIYIINMICVKLSTNHILNYMINLLVVWTYIKVKLRYS